jgi:hypothetical protein
MGTSAREVQINARASKVYPWDVIWRGKSEGTMIRDGTQAGVAEAQHAQRGIVSSRHQCSSKGTGTIWGGIPIHAETGAKGAIAEIGGEMGEAEAGIVIAKTISVLESTAIASKIAAMIATGRLSTGITQAGGQCKTGSNTMTDATVVVGFGSLKYSLGKSNSVGTLKI